jgi:hypothetical protein
MTGISPTNICTKDFRLTDVRPKYWHNVSSTKLWPWLFIKSQKMSLGQMFFEQKTWNPLCLSHSRCRESSWIVYQAGKFYNCNFTYPLFSPSARWQLDSSVFGSVVKWPTTVLPLMAICNLKTWLWSNQQCCVCRKATKLEEW